MDVDRLGGLAVVGKDDEGRAGREIKGATISLYTEIPIPALAVVAFSLWAKSTNKFPKTVILYPVFRDKAGQVVSDIAGERIA